MSGESNYGTNGSTHWEVRRSSPAHAPLKQRIWWNLMLDPDTHHSFTHESDDLLDGRDPEPSAGFTVKLRYYFTGERVVHDPQAAMESVQNAIDIARQRVAAVAAAGTIHADVTAAAGLFVGAGAIQAHASAAAEALVGARAVKPDSAEGQRMVVRACLYALIASASAALSEVDNPDATHVEVDAVVPGKRRGDKPSEGWDVNIRW